MQITINKFQSGDSVTYKGKAYKVKMPICNSFYQYVIINKKGFTYARESELTIRRKPNGHEKTRKESEQTFSKVENTKINGGDFIEEALNGYGREAQGIR